MRVAEVRELRALAEPVGGLRACDRERAPEEKDRVAVPSARGLDEPEPAERAALAAPVAERARGVRGRGEPLARARCLRERDPRKAQVLELTRLSRMVRRLIKMELARRSRMVRRRIEIELARRPRVVRRRIKIELARRSRTVRRRIKIQLARLSRRRGGASRLDTTEPPPRAVRTARRRLSGSRVVSPTTRRNSPPTLSRATALARRSRRASPRRSPSARHVVSARAWCARAARQPRPS